MNNRWIPTHNKNLHVHNIHQILYAVLGPELSQQLVKVLEHSKESGVQELREVTTRLREDIGLPPLQLFYAGLALGGLDMAMRDISNNEDENEIVDPTKDALKNLGWDAYKMFGDKYIGMFERFGFNQETLAYYIQNCAQIMGEFAWPPPGASYKRYDSAED